MSEVEGARGVEEGGSSVDNNERYEISLGLGLYQGQWAYFEANRPNLGHGLFLRTTANGFGKNDFPPQQQSGGDEEEEETIGN